MPNTLYVVVFLCSFRRNGLHCICVEEVIIVISFTGGLTINLSRRMPKSTLGDRIAGMRVLRWTAMLGEECGQVSIDLRCRYGLGSATISEARQVQTSTARMRLPCSCFGHSPRITSRCWVVLRTDLIPQVGLFATPTALAEDQIKFAADLISSACS
jgi:hypothetical protein